MLKRWKTLKSKKVFSCKYYNINHDRVELPSKKLIDYYPIEINDSVLIIPVTRDNKIIFIKQYRYPVNEFYLELPAGNSEGENPRKAAQRELIEETGFKTKKLTKIGEFVPYNGISSEKCFLFIAQGLIKTKSQPDETEIFEYYKIPIKKAYRMIDKGEIKDGMTLAGLCLAQKYLEKYIK
jgi:ADP-ribose pyrophosphatase